MGISNFLRKSKEKLIAEKSINEFHGVAQHWEHLKKTYKDGLELGDSLTMDQIQRFIVQKCKSERVPLQECNLTVINPEGNNTKYRLELIVKVEGKKQTFVGT